MPSLTARRRPLAAGIAALTMMAALAAGACAARGTIVRSSRPFGLPAGAASVDWMLLNDDPESQAVTVTVYKAGVGSKTVLPPGPVTATLAPGELFHNANSVGGPGPFVPGFYYEVVVETTTPYVLPGVHVWQDRANTVIPGTLIPAGSWVRIR